MDSRLIENYIYRNIVTGRLDIQFWYISHFGSSCLRRTEYAVEYSKRVDLQVCLPLSLFLSLLLTS